VLRDEGATRHFLAPDEISALVRTGRRLATRRLYREAIALLQVAARMAPDDREIAALLRQTRVLANDQGLDDGAANTAEQHRRDAIDAAHFLGLAALYFERGRSSAALECLQMAKEKLPVQPYAYKLRGRMLVRQKDWSGAAQELQRAIRFNPFDRETAELLGLVEYERKNFEQALACAIDAFLLLPDEGSETGSRLRRRIRTLRRILRWNSRQMVALFRQRQELLQTAYDRLQWRRDLFLEQRGLLERGMLFNARPFHEGGSRIALASRLRQIPQLSGFADEAIFQLTAVVHEEFRETGVTLFGQGSADRDLFYLERGELQIRRNTPYGAFTLGTITSGNLVGEVNFVDHRGRAMEVVASAPSRLLRIEAEMLERLVETSPDLGASLYASLWRLLAARLRNANDQLKRFHSRESHQRAERIDERSVEEYRAQISALDKMNLFREQGLDHQELLTLATFAQERRFGRDTYVFREGDPGAQMYFVVEGRIRISQFIPGGGEEALAILGRGEFFGEMALIDGKPRSADARTHEGPVTVLELDRETVREALAMDPRAALEFLRLLCRILAARLREVDEKLVLWKILTSPRLGEAEASAS
jgi:CRP/FNR family transcriptional regulator, cyclic AMP receptor protein